MSSHLAATLATAPSVTRLMYTMGVLPAYSADPRRHSTGQATTCMHGCSALHPDARGKQRVGACCLCLTRRRAHACGLCGPCGPCGPEWPQPTNEFCHVLGNVHLDALRDCGLTPQTRRARGRLRSGRAALDACNEGDRRSVRLLALRSPTHRCWLGPTDRCMLTQYTQCGLTNPQFSTKRINHAARVPLCL